MRNTPDAIRPPKKTIRSRYVLGWCLCQNKQYGTIILTTISFCLYKNNYKWWSFYHFIFEHRQSYCISTESCLEFLVVFILLQLSFSCILYVISCMIVFMSPLRSNSTFLFFITNYPTIICFCQVINYNFIKTTKSEPTFGKSSICNQSSL